MDMITHMVRRNFKCMNGWIDEIELNKGCFVVDTDYVNVFFVFLKAINHIIEVFLL